MHCEDEGLQEVHPNFTVSGAIKLANVQGTPREHTFDSGPM